MLVEFQAVLDGELLAGVVEVQLEVVDPARELGLVDEVGSHYESITKFEQILLALRTTHIKIGVNEQVSFLLLCPPFFCRRFPLFCWYIQHPKHNLNFDPIFDPIKILLIHVLKDLITALKGPVNILVVIVQFRFHRLAQKEARNQWRYR